MSEAAATPVSKTVSLTIDGVAVEVPRGTTILRAAREKGIEIPTLCFLEKLLPIGSCRVCSVEVDGIDGPVMSCTTPASDGMVVTTQSDELGRFRQQMMRFILVNHPLDCPTCERSGECSLQNRTFELGVTSQVFATAEYKRKPVADWNVLRYDQNLCVMCERCVRICREIQGIAALEFNGAGYAARVKPVMGEKLDCDFCGQCLSVCPVGAINSAIVLPVRSWEVTKTQTVCPHCAVGCSYHVEVKNGLIARIKSDDNIGINNGNLCARGRFGFEAFTSEDRIKTPLIRRNLKLEPAGWEEALKLAVDRLNEVRKKHGADSVAVLVSEHVTNEDAYVIQKYFREGLGINRLDTMSNMKNPGLTSGLFEQFGQSAPVTSYDEIGKAGSFLFFGVDAARENPVIANIVRVAMRDRGTPLYVANSRETGFEPNELVRLRYNYGTETALVAGLIQLIKDGASAEAAAKTAGVSAGDMRAIAEGIKKNGAPMIFIGKEIHDHPMSMEIVKGLINLADLTGGKAIVYREYSNTQGVTDMGISPRHLPGYVKAASAAGDGKDIFEDLSSGKIKGLFIAGADPTVHYPDGEFVRESIQAAEFVVVTESFMTDTAELADVVLPACVMVERDGTYTNNEGRAQLVRKAVEPVGDSKPEWEIVREMGRIGGIDLSYSGTGDITGEIAKSVPGYQGATRDALMWGGELVEYPRGEGKSGPHGFDAKPMDIPQDKSYPYLAVVGDSLFHLDALSGKSPALNGIEPAAFVEINPEDAAAAGIAAGDRVVVESKQGAIKAVARVTKKSPRGVVFAPKSFENAPALRLVYRNDKATRVNIKKAEG